MHLYIWTICTSEQYSNLAKAFMNECDYENVITSHSVTACRADMCSLGSPCALAHAVSSSGNQSSTSTGNLVPSTSGRCCRQRFPPPQCMWRGAVRSMTLTARDTTVPLLVKRLPHCSYILASTLTSGAECVEFVCSARDLFHWGFLWVF